MHNMQCKTVFKLLQILSESGRMQHFSRRELCQNDFAFISKKNVLIKREEFVPAFILELIPFQNGLMFVGVCSPVNYNAVL